MSEPNAKFWRVEGVKLRGVNHVKDGKPCQDNILWAMVADAVILAVADGHGSEHSPFSDVGAYIAVQVAVELLSSLYEQTGKGPARLININSYIDEQLPRNVTRAWVERVRERAATDSSENSGQQLSSNDVLTLYGSTLLAVLAAPEFLLFVQLGDGDILIVRDDGSVTRPIANDERLFANSTTSLCTPHAWRDMRLAFQPIVSQAPALILLSTDGYKNSFVSEKAFLEIGPDYLRLIKEQGLECIAGQLEPWLAEASKMTGDDVTLGLVCRSDIAVGKGQAILEQSSVVTPNKVVPDIQQQADNFAERTHVPAPRDNATTPEEKSNFLGP